MLSLVALDEADRIGYIIHFSPPGAYHRAGWMANGIYCREQFKINAKELQAIRRMCLFTITMYVKAWLTATITCDAPYNDLCFLQSIEAFHNIDSEVADVASSR